ncbi:MAG TPA: TonB-dependent receptor [Tepidisphaeraceae bacterium]|jgi:long-chain fatty acid transport protein
MPGISKRFVSGAIVVFAMAAPRASGGGFEVPMQSASAAGQADAFTAQADDPSAIFYNPAGITQLRGTNISAGVMALYAEWRFDADQGDGQAMRLTSILPHVYAESDFGLDRWRFGFGIDNGFGINEDWGNKGPLRFLSNEAQLAVINLQPTVAYRATDNLSFGLGVNFYFGQALLQRNVLLGPPPTPEGDFHFRGSAWSYGVTPGVLWRIDDHNSVGAFYRSPFTLDFGGDANLKIPGMPTVGPSRSHLSIDFPQMAGIGYAWRPTKPLKLEFDVTWTDWNTLDFVDLRSSNPAFNGTRLPADWKSGFAYRLGVQYDLDEHWVLRAGYAYGQNAIPTETFSPLVPDSTYHLFALGVGYKQPKWSLDAAYQFIYRETRSIDDAINSPTVDGTWYNQMHTFLVTLTIKL